MTYRERRLAKAERLREWAVKRESKSEAAFKSARIVADGIPLGQPILVGHHSEKRHRRDIARIDAGMRAGSEHYDKAREFQSRADGIEHAADRAIYSDDPDAIEALIAKAERLEADRDRRKAINAAYRKGDDSKLRELGVDDPAALRAKLNGAGVMSWCRIPFPAYELSNLGATIRTTRNRIQNVKARQAADAATNEAGGFRIARSVGGDWCAVQFSDKPERAILAALKAAGFHWGAGRWSGPTSKLPAEVLALETEVTA